MALLRDKLKMSGGLARTSEEELQQLSQAAGRPAPPTTPQETSVIGGSPDQAKMAGTPAQKQSALRLSMQGPESLQDVTRRQQARGARTGEEQQKVEQQQRLESLGGLQARVQGLVGQMTAEAAASEIDAETKLRAQEDPEIQAALEAFKADPSDPNAILAVNQAMGKTTIEERLTKEDIVSNFLTAEEQAGTLTAEAFQDQALVSDIDPAELGFTDMDELATLLGIPPEELGGQSVRQLIESAQAQIEDEYTKVADLEAKASDPNLGPAERAEARKQLRDMGATGVRRAESEVDELADEIANADEIEFGGEKIAVGEMLEDEYLSGLAAKFLQSEEDDPFRKSLKEKEPELAAWIEKNQGVLQEAIGELEEGVSDFAELQFENQGLADTAMGELDEDIMSEIYDDWGELRAGEYETGPALQILNDENGNKNQQKNIYEGFGQIKGIAPEGTMSELANLSEQELNQAGLGATSRQGDKWHSYVNHLEQAERAKLADPNNMDSVSEALFGEGKTAAQANQTAQQINAMMRSGIFKETNAVRVLNEYTGGLDSFQDGESILNKLQQRVPGVSLKEMIRKGSRNEDQALQSLQSYIDDGAVDDRYRIVSHAFQNEGDTLINYADAKKAYSNAGKDWNKISKTLTGGLYDKLSSKGKSYLTKRVQKGWWNSEGASIFTSRTGGQDFGEVTKTIKKIEKDLEKLRTEAVPGAALGFESMAHKFDKDFYNKFNRAITTFKKEYKNEKTPLLRAAKKREYEGLRKLMNRYKSATFDVTKSKQKWED